MQAHPKTTIELIGSKSSGLSNFPSTFVIPKPTIVPIPILRMPLKSNLNLIGGVGTAIYSRSSIATDVDESTGLLVTFNQNVPRFNSQGLLMEPIITNKLLNNRDLTSPSFVKTGILPARDAIGFDGAANKASTATASTPNATAFQSTVTGLRSTYSIDIKRKTGSGPVQISSNGGGTYTDVTSLINPTTYTRVQITQTAANPNVGFRIVNSGDEIIVDYPCLEADTGIASSRTETGATEFTRSFDSLSIAAENIPGFGSNYSISATVTILGLRLSDDQGIYGINFNERFLRFNGTPSTQASNGNLLTNFNIASLTPKIFTVTVDHSNPTSGFKLYAGVDVTSRDVISASGPVRDIFLGSSDFAPFTFDPRAQLMGRICDVTIWDVALSEAEAFALNE